MNISKVETIISDALSKFRRFEDTGTIVSLMCNETFLFLRVLKIFPNSSRLKISHVQGHRDDGVHITCAQLTQMYVDCFVSQFAQLFFGVYKSSYVQFPKKVQITVCTVITQ